MPFGARFAWLVGRNARIGRFVGGRTVDDFEMERRAPVPLSPGQIRRAFEPRGVLFSARRQRGLGPRTLFEVGGDGLR
jgi:hypothetical protein